MNIKFLKDSIEIFNRRISTCAEGRYIYCWIDMLWCYICFGASPEDYFRYELYRKSNYEKNRFTTYRRSQKLIKTYNNPGEIAKVLDKRIANKIFADFISREWLDTESCGYDDFQRFLLKHKEIIVKPVAGGSGKGVCKYSYREGDNLEQKFREIKGSMVEEVIEQHKAMNSLNPSSVNAVRLVTFFDGQICNIIVSYLKIGAHQSVVDNTNAGGLFGKIDAGTGIVFTSCVDNHFQRYLVHPMSGIQIIGFKIPNWEILLETVKKAALLVPELKYLGWDFAILDDGVEFIEANHDPSHIGQMVDQAGTYEFFRRCIMNLKKHETSMPAAKANGYKTCSQKPSWRRRRE